MSADPALRRLVVLTLVRLGGSLLAVAGAFVMTRTVGGHPAIALGVPLVLAGLLVTLLVPRALLRRWRGPR